MYFTIITPSFNQLGYLRRCVASVEDQVDSRNELVDGENLKTRSGVPLSVHHHIQDGASSEETVNFLAEYLANSCRLNAKGYSFSYESVPDEGMYDAINKGVKVARQNGEEQTAGRYPRDGVVAWLNCDEQYLPGTLQRVADYFERHPDVDLLFGGMLMVDETGELLACRKAMPMRQHFLEASYLYNYSCAMFFRASLWQQLDGFDTSFKNAGDEDLVRRAVKMGARSAVLEDYLATFTYSESNLSSGGSALEEHERLKRSSSLFSRTLKLPINLFRLGEKITRGGLRQKAPVEYTIYRDDLSERTAFVCDKPTCRWPGEPKPYVLKHRLG